MVSEPTGAAAPDPIPTRPPRKPRVLVLWNYTSLSANAEVSEPPAEAIAELTTLLRVRGYEARAFNAEDNCDRMGDAVVLFRPDIVFNLIDHFHGDTLLASSAAGLIEIFEYPAVGADSQAIAACQDRLRTHLALRDAQIPCTDFIPVWDVDDDLPDTSTLRFPVILTQTFDDIYHRGAARPLLTTVDELSEHAAEVLPEYEMPFMIEEYIAERRLSAVVTGEEVLPPVEIAAGSDGSLSVEVAALDDAATITDLAYRAARVGSCRDWAQIDLVVTEGGQALVTDVRPCVNVSSHESPFWKAAGAYAGGPGAALALVVESALARARRLAQIEI